MLFLLLFVIIECSKMCFCLINLKEEKNFGKNIVYKVYELDFMINLYVYVIMVVWKRMVM